MQPECPASGRPVSFRVLGPLEVWQDGERVPLGGRHQERALAVLLLDAGRAVTVTRLVEAVWGEQPPSTAAHQIRKIVAQLRRTLPQEHAPVLTDGQGYRLRVDRTQVDLLQHGWHLEQARVGGAGGSEHLTAALALWRGNALGGLGGPVFEAAATALDESRVATLEQLATWRVARDGGADLVAPLRGLLTQHPLRETLRGLLMLALYRSGRQAEALAVHEEGRLLLRDELGVDPSRELAHIHEQILRNDPALQPAAPITTVSVPAPPTEPLGPTLGSTLGSTLPYDVPDFTGRTAELSALLTIVPEAARQALTIVTIDGMAGVGKSALAVHAAHRLADRFPDGQLYLDLHGFTAGRSPLDPGEALDMLLRATGVPGERIPDQLADRAAMWRDAVARRTLLLLLDNAADTAQVRPLLPAAPGSLVITTSRARLTALDGAVPLSLAPPSAEDSRELVTRILGPERVAQEPASVDELVEVCGRLPLALRVAAARLHNRPGWTVAHLVARLRRVERGMDDLAVDDRSVLAAFQLSYEGLAAEHRRLFRLLGLHPCVDFGPSSTAALAGISVEDAEEGLEALFDARQIEHRLQDRYTFHNLARSFARHTAIRDEPQPDRQVALRRLYDFTLTSVRHVADALQPGRVLPAVEGLLRPDVPLPEVADPARAYALLDAEHPSVVEMVRAAAGLGFDLHAGHLACDLSRYLQVRGRSRTAGELLVLGLAGARRAGDVALERRCLGNLFIPLWQSGHFTEALDCAEQALELAEQLDDVPSQGNMHGLLGTVRSSLGQHNEALADHGRALEIHRRFGIPRQEGSALIGISVSNEALGRFAESLAAAHQALAIYRELGDESLQLVAMVNIALGQAHLGDTGPALATLDEARSVAARVASPLAEAMITQQYAEVYRRCGRLAEALQHAEHARTLLEPLDRPDVLVDLGNVVGDIHHDLGRHADSLREHTAAVRAARALEMRRDVMRGLDGMARALRATGELDAARARWLEAHEHAVAMGMPQAGVIADRLAELG